MGSTSGLSRVTYQARSLAALVVVAGLASCAAPGSSHVGPSAPSVIAARDQVMSLRLGGEVDGLAAGGGFVWAYVRDTGMMVRVSQRNGQVRRFPLGKWRGIPVVIAASSSAVWLADQHSPFPDLTRIDPRTGRATARPHLPSGTGPITGMTVAYGSLWVLMPDGTSAGWRVLRLNPRTNIVDRMSDVIPGTEFTGHTAAIWATRGRIWITGSMRRIIRLDPHTLAMHVTATAGLSESLTIAGGHAWRLETSRPKVAVINPDTGQAIRTLAVPPPSATSDDGIAAAPGLLWVFRGSRLAELNSASGRIISSERVDPIAPAFYSPAIVAGRSLWYLAQTSHGTALNHIIAHR
jgi:streptogramin lyase